LHEFSVGGAHGISTILTTRFRRHVFRDTFCPMFSTIFSTRFHGHAFANPLPRPESPRPNHRCGKVQWLGPGNRKRPPRINSSNTYACTWISPRADVVWTLPSLVEMSPTDRLGPCLAFVLAEGRAAPASRGTQAGCSTLRTASSSPSTLTTVVAGVRLRQQGCPRVECSCSPVRSPSKQYRVSP
jgi:hypothetical protein